MSWMQRQMAPNWLVEMEKSLPKKWGISEVYFLTTCRQKKLVGKIREHFFNSMLKQKCVLHLSKPGPVNFSQSMDFKENILGLWIASDGDNLKQKFDLTIEKIELQLQ